MAQAQQVVAEQATPSPSGPVSELTKGPAAPELSLAARFLARITGRTGK